MPHVTGVYPSSIRRGHPPLPPLGKKRDIVSSLVVMERFSKGKMSDRRFGLADSQLNLLRSLMVYDFVTDGGGGSQICEHFVKVCSTLLYVGELRGFLVVDDYGHVSSASCAEFMELFMGCLVMMHLWCVRHLIKDGYPENRNWVTKGDFPKVMRMSPSVALERARKAVYPFIRQVQYQPGGLGSNSQLLGQFVDMSTLAFRVADEFCESPWQGLSSLRGTRRLEVYFTGEICQGDDIDSVQYGEFVRVRLSSKAGWEDPHPVDAKWEEYWSLEACAPSGSLYDDVEALR